MNQAKVSLSMLLLAVGGLGLSVTQTSGQVIFQDDFESGNLNNWTITTGTTNNLTIVNTQNAVPVGGTFAAQIDFSSDRMHHNIIADNGGTDLGGYSIFKVSMFDDGAATGSTGATRVFSEVRGYSGNGFPNGGQTADGTLSQLFAIGKTQSGTFGLGDTLNTTKYQGRFTAGTTAGWFNLTGAADRTAGWHEFSVERLADGTTVNFYVDGVLGRTITATAANWDTVVIGPGLGTQAGTSYVDGVSVAVPEPSTYALAITGALGLWAAARRRK
jgi:hypothetical protein